MQNVLSDILLFVRSTPNQKGCVEVKNKLLKPIVEEFFGSRF